MKFKIGDSVRLKKGWTEMIVIRIDHSGRIKAKYHKASKKDFENPNLATSCKTRHESQFDSWTDVKLEDEPVNNSKKYTTKGRNPRTGTYLNTTTGGDIVLEMDDPKYTVETFHPRKLKEIRSKYFAARAVNGTNSYVRYFRMTQKQEAEGLRVNDLMIDKHHNMFVCQVIYTDFEPTGNERTFQGSFFSSLPF